MITLGLTGSIGMGKSTIAAMFAEEGAAVWDADAAVHRLYAVGGAGVEQIRSVEPDAIIDGAVDRGALRAAILADPSLLKKIEGVIHPLVGRDRQTALEQALGEGRLVAVLDIPLIFETGATKAFDAVVVVSAPADVQRERVLARPNMTAEAFEAILAKQTPDEEKRAGADFVVDTNGSFESSRDQVRKVMDWACEKVKSDA
ncbi:MAG: dephospho-CoA kinase [Paracoccaceae bacterium]|nr:dephospho-CoA kinase [Paracoccaceae bacterium]MDG1369206.1 dephospho-CoA kinase [Paracoccaceae bacterium]